MRPTGLAGRLDRAQRNFLETFPVFVAAVLMVHLLDGGKVVSTAGALLYVGCRAIFLRYMVVCWLRTLSWNIAPRGLVLIMAQLVL